MREIIDAILNNDVRGAEQSLKAEISLSVYHFDRDQLFQEKILHWIYTGDTLLHLAAAGQRSKIAELLIASGADPNAAANRRLSTPLHYAADANRSETYDPLEQVETIKYLLRHGSAIDAQDRNGATPLHRTVRTRCAGAVKLLLDNGANGTIRNKSGSTPFHLAVQNTGRGGTGSDPLKAEQKEIIEIFLKKGFDRSVRDSKGKSVLDCAGSEWIRKMLIN